MSSKQAGLALSVVIPAYNEEKRLPATLGEVLAWLKAEKRQAEVVVVDDGSTDQTAATVQRLQTDEPDLRLVRYQPNKGKGAAIRAGVEAARGAAILLMDADNATPIEELPKLEAHEHRAEVVIGSRYGVDHQPERRTVLRMVVSRFGNWLIRLLLVPGIKDTQCGFKLFEGKAAKKIFGQAQVNRWGFDFEALALARHYGYQIAEVPVQWREAEGSHLRASRAAVSTFRELLMTWWRLKRRSD